MSFKVICIHDVISGKASKKSVIAYCKKNSPIAPCYNEIVFADGSWEKITEGKSNNAGKIRDRQYRRALKGRRTQSNPPVKGEWIYRNKYIYGIAVAPSCKVMYRKDGTINTKHPAYRTLLGRCHENVSRFGILPNQVYGHADLAPGRKVDPYKHVTPNKLVFRIVRDLKKRSRFKKWKKK